MRFAIVTTTSAEQCLVAALLRCAIIKKKWQAHKCGWLQPCWCKHCGETVTPAVLDKQKDMWCECPCCSYYTAAFGHRCLGLHTPHRQAPQEPKGCVVSGPAGAPIPDDDQGAQSSRGVNASADEAAAGPAEGWLGREHQVSTGHTVLHRQALCLCDPAVALLTALLGICPPFCAILTFAGLSAATFTDCSMNIGQLVTVEVLTCSICNISIFTQSWVVIPPDFASQTDRTTSWQILS